MKLSNIESRKLLPRFASKIAWLMDALDSIIKPISERVKSIDAPLTLEAIAALTDEELAALYEQYGVAQYYPELSRSTRDLMLYEMCKIYRYLGTPHAIELLCNYIFDNVPLNVHVLDNLAFDEHGTLIDATLLDVFDIEVNPDLPVLSVDATARLLANIIRFSRNSQALRDVIYTFSEDFDLRIYPLNAGIPAQNWDNDAICEPVTPPTPAYTEITLYLASGNKQAQTGVTSAFTGNVNSTYCYPLYTDAECTNLWNGYDYSNDYKVGNIPSGGVWTESIDSVTEMPDYVGSGIDFKVGQILLDTGVLWFCCNLPSSSTVTTPTSKIVVHIYPKAQQHYAAYAYGASAYGNVSIAQSTSKQCVSKPGSADYIQTPHQFPVITLQKILGAAGNELPLPQYFTYACYDGTRFRIINKTTSSNVRTVVYTLEYPTYYAWVNLTGNTNINSGVSYTLKDKDGNYVEYDSAFDYYPIAMIKYDGTFSSATYGHLNSAKLQEDTQGLGRLCFVETYGSASMSKVWYYKAPKSIRTTFGAAVTIPAGFRPVVVKCLKLFIKASNITKESGSTAPINFEYAGLENEFCNDIDKALFGVGVNPCINMYGFSNPSNFSLFMLSTDSSQTNSSYATSVSASKFNEDGYFVKGVATLKSNHNADTYAGYLQANPMMFVKYNQGVGLPFYFTIQSSMWSYENGVFSWLGNDTDTTDLAYWYKSAPDVQIILEKLPTT